MLAWGLINLGFALLVTILVEVGVAALFRVGRRGMAAVALVNCVTNPGLNLLLVIHRWPLPYYWPRAIGYWLSVLTLEITVILIEWSLLVWALRRTAGTPARLLVLSAAMNLASFVGSIIAWIALMEVAYLLGG